MNAFVIQRLLVLLGALLSLPLALPITARATAPSAPHAVVVSTEALAIRACPRASCAIAAEAPLGAEVEVTGEARDGFVPVAYNGRIGFAPTLNVADDPDDPPFLVAGSPGCRRVALLFNIGVGYEPVAGILDTLAKDQVPAAMFVMGWWAEQRPPILQRLVEDGYLIGSHGCDAVELTRRTDDEVADDVRNAATAIEAATGQPSARYFTPYAAAIDDRVRVIVAAQGFLPVAWEVPAADYGADATEESVYDRVMNDIYDGAIVELHLDGPASAQSTGSALPRIIDDLRVEGYRFVTLPEMEQPC